MPEGFSPAETTFVKTRSVSCDGGEGSYGHPKVYLRIPQDQQLAVCPYCSRHFVLEANLPPDSH